MIRVSALKAVRLTCVEEDVIPPMPYHGTFPVTAPEQDTEHYWRLRKAATAPKPSSLPTSSLQG